MAQDVGNLKTRISLDSAQFEQSMAGINRQLRGLKQEQKAVTSSGTGFARGVEELRSKSDVLNRTLNVQRTRVEELRRRYEESRKATGDNSKETQNANTTYQRAKAEMNKTENALKGITAEIERQTNPWNKLSRNMDTAGRSMQDFGRGMTTFGRGMITRVTLPVVGLGAAALKVGMDFEEGMSKVQAISGATGEELSELRGQARELGASTRFSATEAAAGMEFLAMAGFETNQIMSAMPGLLDLAASSGMDLARSADIASNIISGFNMEAEESGRVADVLAKGASTANTNVEQLGGAMKYAAPVASTLGLEIEGLTASVGFMSDAGIQGEQAGRQLRQGLLRLSNPTGKAADLIEDLGINVFDSNGNIKNMSGVVAELEKGMEDMDSKTRAATLSILFGSESTAGWSTLLDRGSKDLAEYTEELEDSDGAAAKMAETMTDNAKGALIEMRSAAEEAGIAFSEHVLPVITDLTIKGTELIREFGELDEETQKNIIKMGLFAAAIGPVAMVLGQTTSAMGGALRVAGNLSKAIGVARGAGLAASLASLGPLGIGGVAVAGIGAVAGGAYLLHKELKKTEEVNLDFAKSLANEADELENAAEKFDELAEKSKFTNEQLAEMYDINKQLEGSTNPGEIKELSERYEELRKGSGLSKDEIKELFGANEDLIEQAPNLDKKVSDTGNEFVDTGEKIGGASEAVKDFIQNLRDASEADLESERIKLLNEEKEAYEEIKQAKEQIEQYELRQTQANELGLLSAEELKDIYDENVEKRKEMVALGEDTNEIDSENNVIRALQEQSFEEVTEGYKEQLELNRGIVDKEEERLEKLEAVELEMANLLLQNIGINEEGEKGLEQLDKSIEKNEKKLEELDKQLEANGKLTSEEQEQYDILVDELEEQRNTKDEIFEKLGLYSDLNTLSEEQKEKVKSQRKELGKNNKVLDDAIKKAEEQHDRLVKPVTKNINVTDNGTLSSLEKRLRAPISKTVELYTKNPVQSQLNLLGYAKGTDHHPGGSFIAGEEGWELGRMGNRWEMLNFGLYDRPSGYEVFTHDESKRILKSMNNFPKYAGGARSSNAANEVVNQMNNQATGNTQTIGLLERIATAIERGQSIQINGREVANATAKDMDNSLSDVTGRRAAAWGG